MGRGRGTRRGTRNDTPAKEMERRMRQAPGSGLVLPEHLAAEREKVQPFVGQVLAGTPVPGPGGYIMLFVRGSGKIGVGDLIGVARQASQQDGEPPAHDGHPPAE